MAKIFTTWAQDGVELCQPVNQADYDSIRLLINGLPKAREWIPLPMDLIHENQGKILRYSSSPWLGQNALIFRPECFNVIGECLKKRCELLPISCPEAELYFCNPMNLLDALDEQESKIKRFQSGGIKFIEGYAFNEKAVRELHIFKIPNMRTSPTFVSEELVDHWCESELTGLNFELVWDSAGSHIIRNLSDQLTGKLNIRKGK